MFTVSAIDPSISIWRALATAATVAVLGAVALACGSSSDPTPTPTVSPPDDAAVQPTAAPSSSDAPAAVGPVGYDAPAYSEWTENDGYISGIFDGYGDRPGIAGDTFNSTPFDMQQLQGRPIVLNFWFPSCPPCRAELPEFEEAYQEFGPPGGGDVAFVGVQQLGLDSIQDGIDLFEELGVTFPGLPDNGSHIQFAYEIFSFPTTVFLDRNHNEFRKWQGALNHDKLVEILDELVATSYLPAEDDARDDDVAQSVAVSDVDADTVDDVLPERVFAAAEVFGGFGNATGFSGETFHHGMFDTRELEGKPMVINFWFPSCPPCRAEMPNLAAAYTDIAASGERVEFVGVQGMALDTAQKGIEFLDRMGVAYPAIPDISGDIHWAYEISSAPTTYFLNADHDIVYIHQGYLRWNELEEKLALIMADSEEPDAAQSAAAE